MALRMDREGDQCQKPGQHMEIGLHMTQAKTGVASVHFTRAGLRTKGVVLVSGSQSTTLEQHPLGNY